MAGPESADVLAFVARRLYADAIAMVFALRDPSPTHQAFAGLPDIRLAGLGDSEAGELLMSVTGPGSPGLSASASSPRHAATLSRSLSSARHSLPDS